MYLLWAALGNQGFWCQGQSLVYEMTLKSVLALAHKYTNIYEMHTMITDKHHSRDRL